MLPFTPPPGWKVVSGALLQEVNGTVVSTTDRGFLSVNLVNRQTGENINRTICSDNFNWRTALTFCLYFGHEQAEWGSERINASKFVSKLVYLLISTNGLKSTDLINMQDRYTKMRLKNNLNYRVTKSKILATRSKTRKK